MKCFSCEELFVNLNNTLTKACISEKRSAVFPTVFILLNGIDIWGEVLIRLRAQGIHEIRLSSLPASPNRLPSLPLIIKRINATPGRVLLTPLGELLRLRTYPGHAEFIKKLAALRHKKGCTIVPLLACNADLDTLKAEIGADAVIFELYADQDVPRVDFFAPDLPIKTDCDLRGWLQAMESDTPPDYSRVSVRAPLRFSGNGVRAYNSCYALLGAQFSALEFAAEERALSPDGWRAMYIALREKWPNETLSAAEAFGRCAAIENQFSPADPLRAAAWLSRLGCIGAGAYAGSIMAAARHYSSLEDAVALEILAGFDAARAHEPGILSPEGCSDAEWLSIRTERADMLRKLGIDSLPPIYWRILEHVPLRRKLLYSSLYTPDERAYCRNFLLKTYHLTPQQIDARADIKRLYPEFRSQLPRADDSR